MDPRLKQRIRSRGLLAPTDISRMGLLAELQPPDDTQPPDAPDANQVTTPPSPQDAIRKPLSPPDKAPPAQSAADVKPPSDKERLRAFLMQRVTGAPDAAAPVSPEEEHAKFRDSMAPYINKVESAMWARLGSPAPALLPTNTAAPYQTDREKLNDYLRAQMATKTGVAQQLYGDMTAEDTAAATQAQAKARQEAADKEKAAELERQKARDAEQKARDDEAARHNKETEDLQRQGLEAKAKKGAGGSGDPTYAAMPGYVHDPKVGVQKEEAQKLRDAVAEKQVLDASIDKLMAMVRKNGLEVMPDDVRAEMQGLLKDIQLQAKGPAMYQLGVLSGPDMAILEQVTGDPTNWKSAFGGPEGVLTRLATMKSQAQSRLDAKLSVRGYSAAAPRASAAPGAPSTVTLRDKKTGVVAPVSRSDWDAASPAEKAEFEVVNGPP